MSKGFRKNIPPSQYVAANGGMTLFEVIMAIAIMAFAIAASAAAIKVMGKARDIGNLNNDLNRIVYGINEYQMITKNIPAGASWPAALNDFVEPTLRSNYSYTCNSTTSNIVTITTVSTYSYDPTQKLKDQNICSNDLNTVYNANKTVTCRLVVYATQVCS